MSDSGLVRSFRDLRVYGEGLDAGMRLFEWSKGWPPEEKFSLTDQIRRSSRSVCANIAEAWRKRRYPAQFVYKLSDADAEAAEYGSLSSSKGSDRPPTPPHPHTLTPPHACTATLGEPGVTP